MLVTSIDHPPRGSKDVADAMAGTVYTLMGDRKYRRNIVSITTNVRNVGKATGTDGRMGHPALGSFGEIGTLTGLVQVPSSIGGALDHLKPSR